MSPRATEYVLTGGRRCVVFQLIDDHSRYAVASHVAASENAEAAIRVFDKAVAAHGVPQRLLSDNGIALNPVRRGHVGQLVAHVAALGVEAITGKPYKPTTQGKNERLHQTLFRYLDKQPLAATLEQLQAHVDAFDTLYNTELLLARTRACTAAACLVFAPVWDRDEVRHGRKTGSSQSKVCEPSV